MNKINLREWGWSEARQLEYAQFAEESADIFVGRVIEESRDQYQVITEMGIVAAEVTGQFRYRTKSKADYPVVGDWVILEKRAGSERNLVTRLLSRHSKIARKVAGDKDEEQVFASNVDVAAVITSYSHDFNPRKVERFFSILVDSGAQPILILSKGDLLDHPSEVLQQVQKLFAPIPVFLTSVTSAVGLLELKEFLSAKCVVFVGVSGSGKSSLANSLLGAGVQETQAIREKDSKGRHTTTKRSLLKNELHTCIIDTPGIRELQLFESQVDVESIFAEISEIAEHCRFADCTHREEPGCAVTAAIKEGRLELERYESFIKLKEEINANEQKYERQKERLSRDQKNKLKGRSLRKDKSWKKI